MKVLLLLAAAFLLNATAAYGQEKTDSAKTKKLDEVVVTADNRIRKEGYEILLLNKENRDFGTNALDAVSSLSRFRTSINETSLVSWDRSEVFILINGIPSSAVDLRSYKGSDIKNVEYYPVAPPQYMALTSGPVANIVLKKRHDRLYSGYVNTSTGVNTGFGTDQIDLSYRDSLNQVKLDYFVDYRDIRHIGISSNYRYSPQASTSYNETRRQKGALHDLRGSYQLYRGGNLFNARLKYTDMPGKKTTEGSGLVSTPEGEGTYGSSSLLESGARALSLDLYYSRVFSRGNLMAVNVVNTFGKSFSESSLWPRPGTGADIPEAVGSRSDNRTYSLIASALYADRALGGQYTIGSRYEFNRLRQTFSGETGRPAIHNEFLNAGIGWFKNGCTLYPALGLTLLRQEDADASHTALLPYARVYADWWAQGALNGLSVQLTAQTYNVAPRLAMLTGSRSYMDYGFYSTGNPDLEKYRSSFLTLVAGYFAPGSRNQVVLKNRLDYDDNPIASVITEEDGMAVLRPRNISHALTNELSLTASWYPLKWLELSPYIEYYTFRNTTPTRRLSADYLRYGGSVTLSHKGLELVLAANSPTREYDGDIRMDGSAQFSAAVQYKLGDWAFGARYSFLGHNDRTTGAGRSFSYMTNEDLAPLHNLVRLTASYTFSIGRSRRHGNKFLNESSDENGLNKYNDQGINN